MSRVRISVLSSFRNSSICLEQSLFTFIEREGTLFEVLSEGNGIEKRAWVAEYEQGCEEHSLLMLGSLS